MTPEKEAAIRVAAERLARASIKLGALRQQNTASEPEAYVRQQQEYRVALAEFNEAECEMTRMTRAEYQPQPPKEGN